MGGSTPTDAGRQAADENPISADGGLETDAANDGPDLGRQLRSVAQAATQIQRIGTADAHKAANEILTDARRRLYRLLADDEANAEGVSR